MGSPVLSRLYSQALIVPIGMPCSSYNTATELAFTPVHWHEGRRRRIIRGNGVSPIPVPSRALRQAACARPVMSRAALPRPKSRCCARARRARESKMHRGLQQAGGRGTGFLRGGELRRYSDPKAPRDPKARAQ
jgi:hypothetical protein